MEFLLWLNQFAGLLSLCAVLAAIIVPYVIYRKQRKNELQSIKNELDAMKEIKEMSMFPLSGSDREWQCHKLLLERQLKGK